MRTTLTLDSDVAKLVENAVAEQRKPMKQVINDALRRGLGPRPSGGPRRKYRVRPHRTKLQPGVDFESFNQLADELEDEAVVAKTRPAR